jgi:excisionase family DNA binding protein
MDSQHIPKFLTPPELAQLLGISKASVYRLVGNGSLPFYKIGGSLRFSEQDISQYLEDSKNSRFYELNQKKKMISRN